MAHFNEILAARYNAILTKILTMKEGAPAPTLSTDIQAGIVLEQDRPEWLFLAGERASAGFAGVAAGGAGTRSMIRLRNPANSGIIATVEKIVAHSLVATKTFVIRTNAGGTWAGAASGAQPTDLRWPIQSPACQVFTKNDAAAAGDLVCFWPGWSNGTGTGAVIDRPFILVPGTSVLVDPGVDNEAVSAGFFWRERAVDPSELR